MSDREYRLALVLEDLAKQYADDHTCNSSGQWSGEGLPYNETRFIMDNKKYVIMMGEVDE